MPLIWALNENPVVSSKLNKMNVTFWANQAAIDTTQVQVGSIVYLEDRADLFRVKTLSPLVLVALGGGGSVDWPNFIYKEARDHFNRLDINPAGTISWYQALGIGDNTIIDLADDEFRRHATTNGATSVGNNQTNGMETSNFVIWHTKRDKDNSFTKALIEFRIKMTRAASIDLFFGLHFTIVAHPDITDLYDKILITAAGTGNFIARVSQGTAESILDMGVSDDNVHRFRIEWTNTQIEFFLDGVSKGTITTNLPDRPLRVLPHASRNETGVSASMANKIICDYWHMKLE